MFMPSQFALVDSLCIYKPKSFLVQLGLWVITKILNIVVKQCVLNQIKRYWLLFDVFYVAISN